MAPGAETSTSGALGMGDSSFSMAARVAGADWVEPAWKSSSEPVRGEEAYSEGLYML